MMKGNKKQYQTATEMYMSYAYKVNSYDSLTAHEEQVLWDRVEKGDKKALEIIIKACLKYVYGYSLKFLNYKGINVLDLIGEGNIALMKASQKYDRTKGVRFYTYARFEVKCAIIKMVKNAAKQKVSEKIDIDCLQGKDENAFFADDGDSWRDNLSNRIQNYLDKRYYPGAGRLFIKTMLLTTEGCSLIEATAKLDVMPDFIKRMKRDVNLHFKNRKRLAA